MGSDPVFSFREEFLDSEGVVGELGGFTDRGLGASNEVAHAVWMVEAERVGEFS